MNNFNKIFALVYIVFILGMLMGGALAYNIADPDNIQIELDSLRIENKELKEDLDSRQTVGPIKIF